MHQKFVKLQYLGECQSLDEKVFGALYVVRERWIIQECGKIYGTKFSRNQKKKVFDRLYLDMLSIKSIQVKKKKKTSHNKESHSARKKSIGHLSNLQWDLCEYIIVHMNLPPSPVILWIELGGKPKWLPLIFWIPWRNTHSPHLPCKHNC